MRSRFAVVLLAGAFVGCGGEMDQGAADAASDVAAAPSADEAAIDEIRSNYAEHFNMHHASVVADLYADSAVALMADGSIFMGKAAILADLEADMAATPTLSLTPGETMVFGDHAVAHGEYGLSTTPQGGTAMTLAGNYLTFFTRENGAWKISAVITNLNAPAPEGMPMGESPAEEPPENGTLKDLAMQYAEHYNMGHANVVAGFYTEDATVSLAGGPRLDGRAAVEAALTQRMSAGSPQITIHDVQTTDLADGWKLDGGWYEVTSTGANGPETRQGTYLSLVRREPDGSWKIHWTVTNGRTMPAAG